MACVRLAINNAFSPTTSDPINQILWKIDMVDAKKDANANELPDYDEYVFEPEADEGAAAAGTSASKPTAYVGVHSTSFKDMLLKPELQQSIVDCGFEHPSDV